MLAAATMNSTVDVDSTVSRQTLTNIFHLSVRYQKKPSTIAHTQAAIAPSVAVKRPVAMPPMSSTGVTADIAAWVLNFTKEPWVFLLLANLLMLFVGCFLETTAAITILVPILLPISSQLGIDPVHFGVVMVLNLMIGVLHPPMGMVLFVLARIANLSIERTTMAILPWLIPLLLSLALITYWPATVLWLPKLMQ